MGVRLNLWTIGAVALAIAGCDKSGSSEDDAANSVQAADHPSPPVWRCPAGTPQPECPAAWFRTQKALVLLDFRAAQDLEDPTINAFTSGNDTDGIRLEVAVGNTMHHSDPTWLYDGGQLQAAGVPFPESDSLAECISAVDTMGSLVISASGDRTEATLKSAEKDRHEYVDEARKCERGMHLAPRSSNLRSHRIALVDETPPST